MSLTKFKSALKESGYIKLPPQTLDFLETKTIKYRYSFQEIKQLLDIAIDFYMWKDDSFEFLWQDLPTKEKTFQHIKKAWIERKNLPRRYKKQLNNDYKNIKIKLESTPKPNLGLGRCPVASVKTRCCNLLTLDAVESCGFDCSYCAIQSFYNEGKVSFDTEFINKLKAIEIDPNRTYHIGTGQSSDSLMWGNHEGILDALFSFAHTNPNVILELKTKSDNIGYLLKNNIPKNILTTWSLNPQNIIDHEEHLTANLKSRINSAKAIANKGNLVGFHFHPMVYHEGWKSAYEKVAQNLMKTFEPESVAMISMGALTFIKPVIKKLRQRALKSKILQMPLEETGGKFSYTTKQKEDLFSHLYSSFAPWHEKVFFYLCMEEIGLWKKVFGYEYKNNDEFESAMLKAYKRKIEEI